MPGPIDVAYIEILPDLKRFRQNVVREIKKALQEAAKEVDAFSKDLGDSISKSIGKGIDKSSGLIGKSISDSITKGIKNSSGKITASLTAPIDQAAAQIEAIASEIGTGLSAAIGTGGGADGAGSSFGGMGKEAAKAISKGIKDSKKETAKTLTDAVKEAADEAKLPIISKLFNFGREAGEAFGRGFGNVKALLPTSGLFSSIGSDLSRSLGGTVTKLLPIILPSIGALVTAATGLLGGTVIAAAAAFALKENEKFANEIKKTGETVSQVFTRAAQPLVGPFVDGLKEVQSIVKGLEPTFKRLFAGMAPAIKVLTASLGPTLNNIFSGLEKSLPGINAAFQGLAQGLPAVGKAVGDAFVTILGDEKLVRKVTSDLTFFTASLVNMFAETVRFMTTMFGFFVNFMRALSMGWKIRWAEIVAAFDGGTGAVQRLAAAWAPLKTAITAVWDAMKIFAAAETDQEIIASLNVLVQKIKETWGPLKTFLGVVWDEAWAFVKRIWNEKFVPWWNNEAKPFLENQVRASAKSIFKALVGDLVAEIASLPGKLTVQIARLGGEVLSALLKTFAGAGGWLSPAGAAVIRGFIQGMLGAIPGLRSTAAFITSLIPIIKGPPEKDKVLLRPAGRMIMQGLQQGMTDEQANLQRQLSGITTRIETNNGLVNGVRVHNEQPTTQGVTLTINSGGSKMDELIVQILRKVIRVQGGNVQTVLGKTAGGMV